MSRRKTISHHLHRAERAAYNVLRALGLLVLVCLLARLATGG